MKKKILLTIIIVVILTAVTAFIPREKGRYQPPEEPKQGLLTPATGCFGHDYEYFGYPFIAYRNYSNGTCLPHSGFYPEAIYNFGIYLLVSSILTFGISKATKK